MISERPEEQSNDNINVGKVERWLSTLGGGGLVAYGLKRRSWPGLALALLGGVLLHRGITGRCYVYQAIGTSTAQKKGGKTGREEALQNGGSPGEAIELEKSITIEQPPEALYPLWKNLKNLPRFFDTLESVREESEGRSYWMAANDTGPHLEWEAHLIEDHPNQALSWGAGEGGEAEIISVRFEPEPNGIGTRVRLFLKYDPAHSLLGAAFARLFGRTPEQALERSLDQFKRLIVTGEISEAA
ncbi:MAG: DUF2892 domain-containing protein [Candidatus Manganitrophaceae bacterium]|nr:MAG: DUF2892 domain-containing protein [Candidatus Manganitrophaceae bacterium]